MPQLGLTYDINDAEVQAMVKEKLARLQNMQPAMEVVGEIGLASFEKNFEVGGRPNKWPELKESTIKERSRRGKWPGKILVRSGNLKRISYEALAKKVIWSASGEEYAAIQHFGGKAGRNHAATIPPRPYLLLQDEDKVEITHVLIDHVMEA